MPRKSKRRRLDPKPGKALGKEFKDILKGPPVVPATEEEKRSWRGWCELESEPALFNVMLRELGVKGVKVQELWSMDEQCLAVLPRPIYGLIFLFRWVEDIGADHENEGEKAEEEASDVAHENGDGFMSHVWFANQVADNSCASVALMNVLNNATGIELGEQLQSFKDSTADMDCHERGVALARCEHIRAVHNSFARKMDMLVADQALKEEVAAAKKGSKIFNEEEESGYHFIAFIPSHGRVWKIDGYETEPQALDGSIGSDWLDIAGPAIQTQMLTYATDQLEFSLLGIVNDANSGLHVELVENIKALNTVWGVFEGIGQGTPPDTTKPDKSSFGFLENVTWDAANISDLEDAAESNPDAAEALDLQLTHCSSRADFIALLSHLAETQHRIRARFMEERSARLSEDDIASRRRHDFGPAIFRWLQLLEQKGELETLAVEASKD